MKPIRTWIVDDEPLARERLRELIAREPDFELIGESQSGREAIEALSRARPDLLFLDVQMPECDGFSVARALDDQARPVVVFVTAFDRYALQAFEVHALDYLLKPFDRERFRRALTRVKARIESERRGDVDQRLDALLAHDAGAARPVTRLAVKSIGRVSFVDVEDVDWIEACGNYVRLHAGARAYLRRETLMSVERRLDRGVFVRIHRSSIVNSKRVRALEPSLHGDAVLILADGTRLALSRSYRERAQRSLGC
jgi:two-component system LytT family response regulator